MNLLIRRAGAIALRFRWAILAGWLGAAALLNLLVPQLSDVIRHDSVSFLPPNAAVMQAYAANNRFGDAGDANGFAMVVMANPRGLSHADDAYYAALVRRLESAKSQVVFVQDVIAHPELSATMRSKDGKAMYLPVGLRSPVGSAMGDAQAPWLRSQVAIGKPADLSVHVTGDTAIISDFQTSVENSTARTAVITALLVLVILLAIYRSPVTPLIPLTTIGLALLVTRPLVALLGLHVLKVASFTDTFIIAIVFGAGTDYCIFMISRFKEQLARGDTRAQALGTAVRRVGLAVTGSAATVVVGGMAMLPANVSLFSTTGPAIAVSVVVTLLAGVTLTPALIAIGGARFFRPHAARAARPGRFWSGAALLITRRPRRVFVAALLPLLLLASVYPTMATTFNERQPQPQSNDSIQGLRLLGDHFIAGEVLPDYLVVEAGHDLRNPQDLATLDRVTRAVAGVAGVTQVRSFTQPTGSRLPQTSVPYQAGVLAQGLGGANAQLQQGSSGAARLGTGSDRVAAGAAAVAGGAATASSATAQLAQGLQQEQAALQQLASGSGRTAGGAQQLRDGAGALAAGLAALRGGVAAAVAGMDQVLRYFSIDPDPGCRVALAAATPCQQAQRGLQSIDDAERSQLLPGLDRAIAGAHQLEAGGAQATAALDQIGAGLQQAENGVARLEGGVQQFQQQLSALSGGASAVSAGAAQVSGGVAQLQAGTGRLSTGLGAAAGYLSALSDQSSTPGLDTFYVPSASLNDPRFALARFYYLSSDGRSARLLVFGHDDPFGDAARARIGAEQAAATSALQGTRLAGAHVLIAGDAALNANLSQLFTQDFRLVALAVMLGVLVILVLLLRSLVAPLYLLASVVLSYAAAMGLTTLVWQDLLHMGAIDWTVGIFAFMMLVSVGADYNIFLMTRVREEVRRDPVDGIRTAVTRTGAIITSAGVIFAGTFAALILSGLSNIAEAGFAITCGLLLDTFIVRSFLIPAVAVLLGRWSWWPSVLSRSGQEMLRGERHPRSASPLQPAVH